jgi:soluble cytochrome b562
LIRTSRTLVFCLNIIGKSAEQSVLALLELKKENHKLIEGVFENDPECLKGFIKGMETLINIENDKTAH